jgi:hypothetical protein
MKTQFTLYGNLDALHGWLHHNIGGVHHGIHRIETPYKGSLFQGGFRCSPVESSSSAPPRIVGEIQSAGKQHTVTIRLRRMFLYHFMLVFIAIVPVSTLGLTTALIAMDLEDGHGFSWASIYMPIPVMLIASLPFLWMWISVTYNAKKEFRIFCERLMRGARA